MFDQNSRKRLLSEISEVNKPEPKRYKAVVNANGTENNTSQMINSSSSNVSKNEMENFSKENDISKNQYETIEAIFNSYCPEGSMEADNSDDEEGSFSDKEKLDEIRAKQSFFPAMKNCVSPDSKNMTIATNYHGKAIRFKGNQLIVWVRNMMEQVVNTSERDIKIANALSVKKATIVSPNDWLDYEGMFDAFQNMAAKQSEPFYGILTIHINQNVSTIVEFRNKVNNVKKNDGSWVEEETILLYVHLSDKILINFLQNDLKLFKYKYSSNHGLSYPDIVIVIEKIKSQYKMDDESLAKRQLQILKISTEGVITPTDRFLAYFNAVIFGSETSRNSTSFLTGIITLEMISEGKLTYSQAFRSPSNDVIQKGEQVPYAVFPMASPYAGAKNILAYKELVGLTSEEEKNRVLSSRIGMKSSRKRPKWSQIQLKEAILFKIWADNIDPNPKWINYNNFSGSSKNPVNFQAVEFAKIFNQNVIYLLHKYFSQVKKLFVYSKDEEHVLGWFKPSNNIWEDSQDNKSFITDFDALEWKLTTANPLQLEKHLFDVMCDIQSDVQEAMFDAAQMNNEMDEPVNESSFGM